MEIRNHMKLKSQKSVQHNEEDFNIAKPKINGFFKTARDELNVQMKTNKSMQKKNFRWKNIS